MRSQFVKTITDVFETNDKVILILGDIGVYGFEPLSKKYPDRVINIGICEQATIGVCAGLAKEGFFPIFFSIAPFAVERCYEQIKIDIGYQNLPIAIVSVGGSYDYAALGCTHHSPGDIAIIKTIPNIRILTPIYIEDVDSLFKKNIGVRPFYMRLHGSIFNHVTPYIPYKKDCAIFTFGSSVGNTVTACKTMGIYIFEYNIASDIKHIPSMEFKKIAIIEPWYAGTMENDIHELYPNATILSVGVPRKFLINYGTKEDHDKVCGLDIENLKNKLTEFFNG
jgi:transketolase